MRRLSDKRFDSVIQHRSDDLHYDFNKSWSFWFFVGKILSNALFGNEEQLEWLNVTRVRDREFISFTKVWGNKAVLDSERKLDDNESLQIVEVDFIKPVPGEELKAFWKPAREIICQRVQWWVQYERDRAIRLESIDATPSVNNGPCPDQEVEESKNEHSQSGEVPSSS
ncbi:uncharacterized protein BDV14DRAFT_202777 [Aspergillus stella-maris]|uniref:uncharacterized protein n=1 Tax=Aspergillus stella-maris TaxID=1810926 RepID=UPI003CCE0697